MVTTDPGVAFTYPQFIEENYATPTIKTLKVIDLDFEGRRINTEYYYNVSHRSCKVMLMYNAPTLHLLPHVDGRDCEKYYSNCLTKPSRFQVFIVLFLD